MSSAGLLQPPRGMRDFYPDDMRRREAIFAAWREAAARFGFEPYDACVVETLDLLKRKGGEEIAEQLYTFQDKSGRDLALRAEMTPTLARLVAARQNELSFPLKWYAVAQCFRYERMSRGRKREHFQWNLDIVGESSVAAEAEVLAAAHCALGLLGLGDGQVVIHVNSRALLSELLSLAGIPPNGHAAVFLALDKRGKVEDATVKALLAETGLDPQCIEAALRMMTIGSLDEAAAFLGRESPALRDLRELLRLLSCYGLGPRDIQFDISVIRGLGYYTGIVFEAFDKAREFRAVFGGGRYENLLKQIGGRSLPAVGLGFGDVVIGELLARQSPTAVPPSDRDMAVTFMDDSQRALAMRLARQLRQAGCRVDLALTSERPKAFFSRAARSGFRRAVIIGPDEAQQGLARVKNLLDRTEETIRLPALNDGT